MRPNEVIELAMRRVYAQEAKNVVDTVAVVCDDLEACLCVDSYYILNIEFLRGAFQRLIYADSKAFEYGISGLSAQQLIATALGYIILHHAGQQ